MCLCALDTNSLCARIYDEYGRVLADNHYGVDPNTNREEFFPVISEQNHYPAYEYKEGVYEYDETTKTLKVTTDYWRNNIYNRYSMTVVEYMPNGIRRHTRYSDWALLDVVTKNIDDKDCNNIFWRDDRY